MATVIYERRGDETKLYASAVTYPDGKGIARCTTYPDAPDSDVRNERMDNLASLSYRSKEVDIPLSRVVRVER